MTSFLAYFIVCLISDAIQRTTRRKKTNKGDRYDERRIY